MTEILSIEQCYRDAIQPIANIPALVKALNLWYLAHPAHNFLHPCIIEGKAALVCQRDLSQSHAQAFAELSSIAAEFKVFLKEDKRTENVSTEILNRRKKIVLVLSFCIGLIGSSRLVYAAESAGNVGQSSVVAHLSLPASNMQLNIHADRDGEKIISLRHSHVPSAEEVLSAYSKKLSELKYDAQAEQRIKDVLISNYQPETSDPDYIKADIAEMAHYYAKFPEVVQLLEELQQKKLVLKFKANNWQAQAWGNQYAVDSVTVFFDTRVGAQVLEQGDCHANPACDISPADALLHELLHAKLMLLDSKHFIDIGGMQQTLYPFEHEKEVIANENQLYHEMTLEDGLARPLRQHHSGTLFHVNCAACQPAQMFTSN